jgi:capsular exopolysaccharide synthesis family protein
MGTSSIEPEGNRYPPTRDDEDVVSLLLSLLRMLRRRIRMILLVVLLGTGLAGLIAHSREPAYTAQALVMLESKENRIVNVEAVAAGRGTDVSEVETQVRLLNSPVYLTRLAEKLYGPELDPAAGPELSDEGPLAKLAAMVPKDWLIASGLADEKATPADPEAERELLLKNRVVKLARALAVRQEGRSLVLSVNYTAKDPAQAAEVANALVEMYIEDQVSDKLSITKKASDWLEVRLAELRRQLESSEQAAERYRRENSLLESRGLQLNAQQVSDLTSIHVTTRAARSEKETRLRYIRSLQAKGESLGSVTEVLESPYLLNLWEQGSALQHKEAELRGSLGDRHPQVQAIVGEQKSVREKIDRETKRLVDNISNEVSVLVAKERSIQADIDALIRKTDQAGQAEVELRQLERQAEADRRLYEEFLQRFKETKEQEGIIQPNAKMIAPAKEPAKPSSVPPGLILLAGFLGSSMAGVGLAWLTERLDSGVRSGKQIEAEFGVPYFGLVPFLREIARKRGRAGRPHRYLLAKPLSVYAETLRSVHTALRLGSADHPPRVIQVTSSVPGEGKTVFAVSFATLLAQGGHRTLLLDLDLRHPSVRREIEIPHEAALIRYMLGELAYDELAHRDEESGLDVIAVRLPPRNSAAILASQQLRDLVRQLRERYEYIIVDSTPVLGVSDSKVTAELVDAVLFVVRWERTTSDTLRDALKELVELKLPVSGVVLTQVDLARHSLYGYGGIDNYYAKHTKYYQN